MTGEPKVMDWGEQGGSGPEAYQAFLVPAMFAPFAVRLADRLQVPPGARVLDVACGTGALSRELARRAGPDGAVTGVDLGPPMLAVARRFDSEPDAAAIAYLEGSADALPVADAAFDVITCQQGLQFFPDRSAALAEMRRAAAPGARIGIATWTAIADQQPFAAVAEALVRHVGAEQAAMLESPFALSDPDELAGLLDAAGFADTVVTSETLPTTFATHADFAARALAAGPIAPLFAAVPAETRAAVGRDAAQALSGLATPDGGLACTMTSLVAIAAA